MKANSRRNQTPEFGTATFSGANKTATITAANAIVRVSTPITGKKLIAFRIDAKPDFTGIGLFSPIVAPTGGIGQNFEVSGCWFSNGSVSTFGGYQPEVLTYPAVGGFLGIVIDETVHNDISGADDGIMWGTVDGVNFTKQIGTGYVTRANVEAGIGGTHMGALGSEPTGLYAAVGMAYAAGTGAVLTVLDAWPWSPAPAGFTYLT